MAAALPLLPNLRSAFFCASSPYTDKSDACPKNAPNPACRGGKRWASVHVATCIGSGEDTVCDLIIQEFSGV